MEKVGIDVGAVDGGVATGGPTGAVSQVRGVVFLADKNLPDARSAGLRDLRVATQAKVVVWDGEHFGIHGAVR